MDGFADKVADAGQISLTVADPTGIHEVAQTHAPRITGLAGRTIALLSNGSWEDQRTFPVVHELLQKRFPDAKIIPFTDLPRGTEHVDNEKAIDRLVALGVEAVIVGNAACGSCSTAAGRAAARAEKRGIPTVVITRQGFSSIVDYAFAGLGFSTESAKQVFPMKTFLPDGPVELIEEGMDGLVRGLTEWQPKNVKKTIIVPAPITVNGHDYQDAIDRMNRLFVQNLWSDGLPLVPPTEARVNWMLSGTDLPRDKVIGKIMPRGGIANVAAIATAAAMAGARPEYMPLLIATMEGLLDPAVAHHIMQSVTGGGYPSAIVNGPMAKQIRLNSSYGCLGPSAIYPAGAAIGRAIRLMLINVGGTSPGTTSMSIFGAPGRYVGPVFAEDEAGLPAGWKTLAEERGVARGTNAVTVFSTGTAMGLWDGAAVSEKEVQLALYNFAHSIATPQGGYFANNFGPAGTPGILLIARACAQGFADLGWSKERIKQNIWENARLPESDWLHDILDYYGTRKAMTVKDHIRFPMPICMAPENLTIVVTGGEQATHSFWLQNGGGIGPATKGIALPKGWDALLARAEDEMGPAPGV